MPLEQVDRDLHVGQVEAQLAEVGAHLLHQADGHRDGEPGLLGVVDKGPGRNHFAAFLHPAAEHLAARESPGAEVDHRLVVGLQLAVRDGPFEIERRQVRAAHILQHQHQEGGADAAGQQGEDEVQVGVLGPHQRERHGGLGPQRNLASEGLRGDEVAVRFPLIKGSGIAHRQHRRAVGQRHPHHGRRLQTVEQAAHGVGQHRREGGNAALGTKALRHFEQRHVQAVELDHRGAFGMAGNR